MLTFQAGTYRIGSYFGRADEAPERYVYVPAFEIDEFPVTVEEVFSAIQEGDLPLPVAWRESPPERSSLPAVNLNFDEACHVAKQLKKRLPSEEEFEISAGGGVGRQVACHRSDAGLLPLMTEVECIRRDLVTPEGLIAISGMIWHWTKSKYQWYPTAKDRRLSLPSQYRTIRGGIWSSYDSRVSFRSLRDPNKGYSRVGFRCVKSIG